MQVHVGPELEHIINARVASGLYPSADEVVREAVMLLLNQDEAYLKRLKSLRDTIDIAWGQSERGEFCDPEAVDNELDHIISEAEKNA